MTGTYICTYLFIYWLRKKEDEERQASSFGILSLWTVSYYMKKSTSVAIANIKSKSMEGLAAFLFIQHVIQDSEQVLPRYPGSMFKRFKSTEL